MTDTKITVGKRLRKERATKKLTMADVGKKLNISPVIVSNIENDKEYTKAQLEALAGFYGLDVEKANPGLTFGRRLREQRKVRTNQAIKIGHIARTAGLSKPELMDIELEKAPPPADDVVRKLCEVIGIAHVDQMLKFAKAERDKPGLTYRPRLFIQEVSPGEIITIDSIDYEATVVPAAGLCQDCDLKETCDYGANAETTGCHPFVRKDGKSILYKRKVNE